MKVVKIALVIVLILISIPLMVGIFVDQDYSVVREVTIDRPKDEVYEYVRLLKNQENFSSWASKDPTMKKSFIGVDGEVGFVSAWDSNDPNVGVGEQEITSIKKGERIDYALRFKEPFEAEDKAYMAFEEIDDNHTKVIWGFEGRMDYPMNTMLLMMDMEEMVGKDFSDGLHKLKSILENNN
jgi:uncharacterized protein YndB with AHSA1/START domain